MGVLSKLDLTMQCGRKWKRWQSTTGCTLPDYSWRTVRTVLSAAWPSEYMRLHFRSWPGSVCQDCVDKCQEQTTDDYSLKCIIVGLASPHFSMVLGPSIISFFL